jgi:hypothetical protein
MEGPKMIFATYCWSRIVSFWHLIHNKSLRLVGLTAHFCPLCLEPHTDPLTTPSHGGMT